MARPKYEFQPFPSVRYHPDHPEGVTFNHEEEIPDDGWVDHPSKLKKAKTTSQGRQQAPATARQGSVAVDHTLRGRDTVNRGNPETARVGGATQGGESGQTTDQPVFTLPKKEDVDKTWIAEQLNTRKVPHNAKWSKDKLYQLLHDAVAQRKA